ncbi:MAG: DegT/DnrJ/EryC1/StrS family aminotransferase [Lentisphaeria bacterium]
MGKVPFVDLKRMHEPVRAKLHEAAGRVIDSGAYIGGPEVKGFEQEMAAWMGVPEVVSCACATSGLFSVLKCLGLGPGDEVITTPHTAIATAEAVTLTGASVVFADLTPGGYNLDPREVRKRITPRTKVLLPVHLYGQPADLDAFLALAREFNLKLIEDCAQAQGARYKGQYVGTFGDAAVFSFFPSKNLGGFGDGGAAVVRDAALRRQVRMFSNHGRESKYLHEFEGINSRLDALQAALLRILLPQLDRWNALRREAAGWYAAELGGIPEMSLPTVLPGSEPIYHVYATLVPDREKLAAHLKAQGIGTGIHYPHALNVLPAYARLNQGRGSFPVAEQVCDHELSLPMFPGITREEVATVGQAVRAFFGR